MHRRVVPLTTVVVFAVAGCAGGGEGPGPTLSGGETTTATGPATPTGPVTTTATPVGDGTASTTTTADTATTVGDPAGLDLDVEVVADGFEQPVLVTFAPGGDQRFVVDQPGRIWTLDDEPEVFLDLSDRVRFGGEQGLLGLAFPPDHATSGRFFIDYVADEDGATRVSSFTVGNDGRVDPDSERVLLTVAQPARNHNGGMIAFGPEGHLWVGMGDGGAGDDAFGNGQDPGTLLGSLLRIAPDGDGGYSIPDGNPFADGSGGAPEVWAFGLRNPWRFSFDGDDLWIGDVGQDRLEEIDRLRVPDDAGANLGWPRFEGSECHLSDDCDEAGLVMPVTDYAHPEGCSVTGGRVYRGGAIPELDGTYLYGDYCGGWVRGVTVEGGEVMVEGLLAGGTVEGLTSFGVDTGGELYLTGADGVVYRLVEG